MVITNPHSVSLKSLTEELDVYTGQGLSIDEVVKRRAEYGPNILPQKAPRKTWSILLEQFLDPVIYILGGAVILALFFSEWLEAIAIVVVILITVIIGFYMEWKAIRSIESLQQLALVMTKVLREGQISYIKANELVPGDIILIGSGDVIPADARLVKDEGLAVKEASLTGESVQIEKNNAILEIDTPLADRTNMVFKGTIVAKGNGTALVTATGAQTQLGQISRMTQEAEDERTPLEKKLSRLSRLLIILTIFLATIVAISGYIQGKEILFMIKIGIALAVAAIPEGLPIVATISLARGMVKLAKRNVLIKKLEAVQTLGATTIICSDKTGTLTENKMEAHEVVLPNIELIPQHLENNFDELNQENAFNKLIEVGVLCNNVVLERATLQTDSIELALIELAQEADHNPKDIRRRYQELVEVPFDEVYKYMATLHTSEAGYMICVKGALEAIMGACSHELMPDGIHPLRDPSAWIDAAEGIAARGLRVLAFAYSTSAVRPAEDSLMSNLTLLGIIGFLDPPRTDVREAIKTYKDAGIKVVMITGDHPATARHIGEDIGLIHNTDSADLVIKGMEIDDFSHLDENMNQRLLDATIFARMQPIQKLELVTFFQQHNQVVGMLGDGVNDAPALKKADIGIAMGTRGTEAAKEIADVILLDDQFNSTELAISQGRTIFHNIRNFVMYLLSCNLAEIISVSIASISNLPLPLLPLQILFLNLVTDVFPALALGMGKQVPGIMKRPPHDPNEPILTNKLWLSTFIYGLSITMAVIGISIYAYYIMELPSEKVNNMAFYTLVLAQLLNIFNIPHRHVSFWVNEVTTNIWVWGAILLSGLIIVVAYWTPILRDVLSLVSLTPDQYGTILLFGTSSLILTQIIKRIGGTV